MKITTDIHLHTELSVDAETSIDRIVDRAIEIGLTEIALTDHVDFNPADEGAGLYHPIEAHRATERIRRQWGDDIVIDHGVELSEPHLYTAETKSIYQLPLDLVIGSTHYIGSRGVHSDLFDVVPADDAISQYFDATIDLAEKSDIDVLGHLDYFQRYTAQRHLDPYDPNRFRGQIEKLLDVIIARQIALEINSSGLRGPVGHPFPHVQVIEWYHRRGGRLICLGSDAHRPEHVGAGLDAAAEIVRKLGFVEHHIYRQRRRCALPLTDQ